MNKYIDAEKLKAEIERLMGLLPEEQGVSINLDWARNTLVSLHQFITSLQQEQPEVDLEKEYIEFVASDPVYSKLVNGIVGKSIARHFAEWGAIHLNARKEEGK